MRYYRFSFHSAQRRNVTTIVVINGLGIINATHTTTQCNNYDDGLYLRPKASLFIIMLFLTTPSDDGVGKESARIE